MPQLDPTWFASQLFWLLVSMTVLYVVLARSVLPSLLGVIEKRASTRASDLERAQALKNDAEDARETYERTLAEARAAAQTLFSDAEKKQKQATETALAELNQTLAAKITDAESKIARAQQELLKNLEPAAAELAATAVEKILGKRPDASRAKDVVQQLLRS